MSDLIYLKCTGIERELKALEALNGPEWYNQNYKAIRAALRTAMNAGRKLATKMAADAYCSYDRIYQEFRLKRDPYSVMYDLILYGGRGISLMNFNPNPKTPEAPRPKAGVSAQVKKAGSSHPWHSKRGGSKSFIAKKKQGDFGVFVSHGVKRVITKRGKRKATVIDRVVNEMEMLYGPSPIQALQSPERQELVRERIEDAFMPALQKEIDKMLDREFA